MCDIFDKPVVFVRWNPNVWKIKGEKSMVRICGRLDKLWVLLEPFYEEKVEMRNKVEVYYLYYPSKSTDPVYHFSQEELDEKLNLFRVDTNKK